MENDALERRIRDLAARCEKTGMVTLTGFLTPAEQAEALALGRRDPALKAVLFGGNRECERKAAFFLPFYLTPDEMDYSEYLSALAVSVPFGSPGHRDYMGAILGLGIRREWIGDIVVTGEGALVFCMPSVKQYVIDSLTKVGRFGVSVREIPLSEAVLPEGKRERISFSVMSFRLDAVVSGLFRLSRSRAADMIREGLVSLNYEICLKVDAPVREGDELSVRGLGKGSVLECGGTSRRGRLWVEGELRK